MSHPTDSTDPTDPVAAGLPHPDQSPALRALIERLARRMRPVCPDLPEPEFRALVERMARLQWKYDMRERL
jgi:hypothetical protein